MKNTLLTILAVVLLITIGWPSMLAGFLFQFLKRTFWTGRSAFDDFNEYMEK